MPHITNENWVPVPGYEGAYSVSDAGRVRSEDRLITERGTGKIRKQPGKILRPAKESSGHLRVSLSRGSIIKFTSVHSLVLLAFVGPRPDGADICHADGDPENNRLANLRYDSRASNIADSQAHGTFSEAESHPCALLTDDQALAIYNSTGVQATVLARRHGVSAAVVNQIWRGDSWASVTGGLDVSAQRGVATYTRTILTRAQADLALANRANRSGRKDGRGIKPTAAAIGVDADVIKALYAATDAGKPIIFAE